MAFPILDLADDLQRIAGPVGGGDVAGEFLVGEVGIVLERAGRLYDIDAPAATALRQLRAPGRRVERRREIDVLQLPVDEVAAVAGAEQAADGQVRLGAVVEGRPGRNV